MSLDTIPVALHELTIAQASDLIASKAISPVELTTAYVERAQILDPKINAYILPLFETALEAARQAESAVMGGDVSGPLAGIPFGAKDVFDVAGLPTTGHSRAYADAFASEDSVAVRRLKDEGAILLGKLSTHECAHGGPSFDLAWPPARNPWNLEHFTGGSSSGSGAGVAAGLMPAALGTDTGGSVRNPAAMCGTVGIKPTYGLVSRRGIMTNSYTFDHAGPLAWTVKDCAILLQALAGYDRADPGSADIRIPDYRAALTGDIRGIRIGVLRHQYEEEVPIPAVARQAMDTALDVFRGLGAVLEDARIRHAQDYFDVKFTIAESEIYAVHEAELQKDAGQFGEDFLARTLAAALISGPQYVQAQRERRKMLAEMEEIYARYDVLLTAGPAPAPRLDAWRSIMFLQKPNLTTPFNVPGGPALVQCNGFTPEGLPLSLQIVGRPFAEETVFKVADAYERATAWRDRRPILDANTPKPPLPPVPEPEKAELPADRRDEIAALCRRLGLTLNERHFEQLCATVPYIDAMRARLDRPRAFSEEPMNTFRFS